MSRLALEVWSPDLVCRVRTLCPDLGILSADSGVCTRVHTCTLESRLGRLDLDIQFRIRYSDPHFKVIEKSGNFEKSQGNLEF